MTIYDILGLVAGACVISTMLLRRLFLIRFLLLFGAILFLIYGICLHLLPIIVLNSVGVMIGIRGVYSLWSERRNENQSSE